jgi:hypothetical protein
VEIEAVDNPVHGDAIVAAHALLDRLEAKVADAEARYSWSPPPTVES